MSKIIVAVVVYNRFQNIKRWIECWSQCDQTDAELVIIHNHYGVLSEFAKFQDYCREKKIRYIPRNTKGFDIGAFQDVCIGIIKLDFDYLLWCTDDTIPMSKNFIKPFIEKFGPGVGITCMQISSSVIPHVRTTGFCISKEVAEKIKFQCEITTKQHCYFFEHRGGSQIMTNQIRAMGLDCISVSPSVNSPLWDMGYWRRLDRMNEHELVFGSTNSLGDKVVFICPIYNMYPQIISSLICQTHKNWELMLIHNGPCDNNLPDIVEKAEDSRIKFIEYPEATGKWGHMLRAWALDELKDREDVGFVTITNADNYHVPTFTEYLLKGFKTHTTVATFCDKMVHNYKAWDVIPVKFERGYIDCAGVMIKKDVACEVGWKDTETHSSDWTFFSDIANIYHPKNFVPVKGCLLIHN